MQITPNRILFEYKTIGKVWLQSKIGYTEKPFRNHTKSNRTQIADRVFSWIYYSWKYITVENIFSQQTKFVKRNIVFNITRTYKYTWRIHKEASDGAKRAHHFSGANRTPDPPLTLKIFDFSKWRNHKKIALYVYYIRLKYH